MEAGWKLGGRKKKTVRKVIEGTVFSLFLTKAKKNTCEFLFYFIICGPTRIQPQIQFRLVDYEFHRRVALAGIVK